MSGVFVSKGMTFALTDLVFSLDAEQSSAKVLVHFDVCPIWIELALGHLKAAREALQARDLAWTGNDPQAKGRTLEQEFKAAMQAITCAAIAWDAFYAAIREKAKLDPSISAKWRAAGTARYKQVSETLRLVFELTPENFDVLRDGLRQIYSFRDRAVHPSGSMKEPILHPRLGVGVEERFVTYSYENAHGIVFATVQIIDELATKAKLKNEGPRKYLEALRIATNDFRASQELSLPNE